MTIQRVLFALGWRTFLLMYMGIGVGALVVMGRIEAQFFLHLTRNPVSAYILAVILECAKVGTSLIRQILTMARRVTHIRVPVLLQGFTAVFQTALMLLSLICCVMMVSMVLDGTAMLELPPRLSEPNHALYDYTSVGQPHPMVSTAIDILQETTGLAVKASVVISTFAFMLSALLQGTIYIVAGHILTTQSSEIEYLFLTKLERVDAKKNSTLNT
jgi:hypothetical protein